MGQVVKATLRPFYPRERPGTNVIGRWWAPEPVWMGAEILASTGIRSPDHPARSESLYLLSYPGPSYAIDDDDDDDYDDDDNNNNNNFQ